MLTCDRMKKEAGLPQDRVLDLYLIMALCKTQPFHRMQALRLGINTSYKAECYMICAFLVRKYLALVEENPNLGEAEWIAKCKKILQVSEKRGGNKFKIAFEEQMLYDDAVSMKISSKSFVLMNVTEQKNSKVCPMCSSHAEEKFDGMVCGICMTGELGRVSLGRKIMD